MCLGVVVCGGWGVWSGWWDGGVRRGVLGVFDGGRAGSSGGPLGGCYMYGGAGGAVELTGDCPKGSYRGIIGVLQGPRGVLWGDVICMVDHYGFYRIHGRSFGGM